MVDQIRIADISSVDDGGYCWRGWDLVQYRGQTLRIDEGGWGGGGGGGG